MYNQATWNLYNKPIALAQLNVDNNMKVLAQNQEESTSTEINFQSIIASLHKQYFLV